MNKKIFILILCVIVLFSTISCKKETAENIVSTSIKGKIDEKEVVSSKVEATELVENTAYKETTIEPQPMILDQNSQDFEFYLEDFFIWGKAQGKIIQINYDDDLESFFNDFLNNLKMKLDVNYEIIDGGVELNLPVEWDEDDLLYDIIGEIFSFSYIEEPVIEVPTEVQELSLSSSFLGFSFKIERIEDDIVIDCPAEFSEKDLNLFGKITSEILSFDFDEISYSIENNQILLKLDKDFDHDDLVLIQNRLNSFSSYELRTISFLSMDIYIAINEGKAYLLNPFQKVEAQEFLEDRTGKLLNNWYFITNDIIEIKFSEDYSNSEFVLSLENELKNFKTKPKVEKSFEFELYVEEINLHFTLINNSLTVAFSEKIDEVFLTQKVNELASNLGVELVDFNYDSQRNVLILQIQDSNFSEDLFDNLIISLYSLQ